MAAVLYHTVYSTLLCTNLYYYNLLYICWNVFLLYKHLTHYLCRKWSVAHRAAQKKPSGWSSGASLDHNPSLHTSVWQIFSSSYLAASAALTKTNELISPLIISFSIPVQAWAQISTVSGKWDVNYFWVNIKPLLSNRQEMRECKKEYIKIEFLAYLVP